MRASPTLVTVVALSVAGAAGCRGDKEPPRSEPPRGGEPGAAKVDRDSLRAAALLACVPALDAVAAAAGRRDRGLADLLAGCHPCTVAWDPLIALSAHDPDARAEDLPPPAAVLAVLDACEATCTGTALTELGALLDRAREGRGASAPFKKLAEACHGALRVDDHTGRFARGTLYALDQIQRALWADGAPRGVVEARRPLIFPLPPLSIASTAIAMPRTDALAPWAPRVHLTVSDERVHVGVAPWLVIDGDGLRLLDGPGLDYPGDDATADPVAAVRAAIAAVEAAPHDLDPTPVMIAPRAMKAVRVVTVIAELATLGRPIHLAATPATRAGAAWADELAAIAVPIATAPTEGMERIVIPAHATVADLAAALSDAAGKGVRLAWIAIDPASSP